MEISHPTTNTTANQERIAVRRGYFGLPGSVSFSITDIASRLQIHHRTLTINPRIETAARWKFVSAVPSAATMKLLGIKKISVILIRSGCGEVPKVLNSHHEYFGLESFIEKAPWHFMRGMKKSQQKSSNSTKLILHTNIILQLTKRHSI